MLTKEPKKITIGPYTAVQCVSVEKKEPENALAVNDSWALPGGLIVTTAQLQKIAVRNGWRLG